MHGQKQFRRILTLGVRGWCETIFELEIFYVLSVFLILCFPLLKNPVGIVGTLVCMSLVFVRFISTLSRRWFSFVLFLVYVGGLLVLFMYICLIRRNYSFGLNISWVIFAAIVSVYLGDNVNEESYDNFRFLGGGNFDGGSELVESVNLSIFLFLGILLLIILLVVVRASGAGSLVVSNEKS